MSEKLDSGLCQVKPIAGLRVGGEPETARPGASGACATPWASQGSGSDPQQKPKAGGV